MNNYEARAKVLRRLAGLAEWIARNEDGDDPEIVTDHAKRQAEIMRSKARDDDKIVARLRKESTERSKGE